MTNLERNTVFFLWQWLSQTCLLLLVDNVQRLLTQRTYSRRMKPIPILRENTSRSARMNNRSRYFYPDTTYDRVNPHRPSWPNHVRFQRQAPEAQGPKKGMYSSRAVEQRKWFLGSAGVMVNTRLHIRLSTPLPGML